MKKINESYKLIVFAALALALVLYIGNIWSGLQSLTSVFSPIILGGVLAFIFNVPMKKLEDFLDKCRVPQKLQRSLALVLEVLILALIMTVLVTLGQDPMLLFGKTWVQGVVMYAAIPLFFILYLGYKFKNKTKLIPLKDVDLSRHKD